MEAAREEIEAEVADEKRKDTKEEMSRAEDAKIKQEDEESNNVKEQLDTLIPQAIKAAPRTCEQENRQQGGSSSKALNVTEVDINQHMIEKKGDDLKESVHEEKKRSKEKGDIEKEKQVKLVKEEVTNKEGSEVSRVK